jgi:hypothetical protein
MTALPNIRKYRHVFEGNKKKEGRKSHATPTSFAEHAVVDYPLSNCNCSNLIMKVNEG